MWLLLAFWDYICASPESIGNKEATLAHTEPQKAEQRLSGVPWAPQPEQCPYLMWMKQHRYSGCLLLFRIRSCGPFSQIFWTHFGSLDVHTHTYTHIYTKYPWVSPLQFSFSLLQVSSFPVLTISLRGPTNLWDAGSRQRAKRSPYEVLKTSTHLPLIILMKNVPLKKEWLVLVIWIPIMQDFQNR